MNQKSTSAPIAENKMGTMPVGRLVLNMSLPMMISMLVQALYNIVDSVFVAMLLSPPFLYDHIQYSSALFFRPFSLSLSLSLSILRMYALPHQFYFYRSYIRASEPFRPNSIFLHIHAAVIKAAGKTEEPRKESDKTASVKTGDKTDPAVYIFFVILTGGMIAILSAGNRKNRRK